MYIAGTNRDVDTGDTYFEELQTTLSKQVLDFRNRLKSRPVSSGQPLLARINHGRWVVDCPNCNNVEFAFNDRLFFCSECKDETKRVRFPQAKIRIEKVLGKRLIVNRHWKSPETVDDLIAENKKSGIEED